MNTYFTFYFYWLCFSFCLCFFSWSPFRNYKFYSSIKNFVKEKKHEKIVVLAKAKLNSIEVLISEILIDSYIGHDESISVNEGLKQYEKIKQKNQTFQQKINMFEVILEIII